MSDAPVIDSDDSLNLILTVGNDEENEIHLTDGNDDDINIEDATVIHLSIKETAAAADDSDQEIFEKDLLSIAQPNLSEGKINVNIDNDELTDDQVGDYIWDVRIVSPTEGTFNRPKPPAECIILPRVRRTN